MRPNRVLCLIVICSSVVVSACSGGDDDAAPASSTTQATTTTAPPEISESTTLVALAEVDVVAVYDSPTAEAPTMELDRRDETTGTLVFVVDDAAATGGERHRVQLPVRPNGSTGWIDAADVSLTVHDFRIEIALGDFELKLYKGDEELLVAPIGTGTQDTPTPGGTYYIKELLRPPSPDGPYGTYAYGLSGFSNVLDDFAGGTGVIGLHGTDRPDLIGTEASHGCIRVENAVIDRLVEEIRLPLGVPVTVLG